MRTSSYNFLGKVGLCPFSYEVSTELQQQNLKHPINISPMQLTNNTSAVGAPMTSTDNKNN